MRMALVSEHYAPHVGGIEAHVGELARRLAARGHEVAVITSSRGPGQVGGTRVHRVRVPLLPVLQVPFTPRGILRLESLLQEEGYGLVHCHHSVVSPGVACAAYLARRLGIPTVLTFHSLLDGYTPAFAALDRWAGWSRWPVAFTAVSELVADKVRDLVGGRLVTVLPNGVDREFWLRPREPAAELSSKGGGELRLVATLRLAPRKRPRALVEMVAALRGAIPAGLRFRLRILGEGPERRALEGLVARLGLGGVVELPGELAPSALREEYARSHLFVLPSVDESFGLAALEARSAGLPVVAMAGGGVEQYVEHGREGLLARSDAEMVEHLARLLTDAGLRSAMERHNRGIPPPFTWDEVLDRHLRVYEKAAALAGGGAEAGR